MPQMAPIMWLFLSFLFLSLIYLLASHLFFTMAPTLLQGYSPHKSFSKLHWKW
uniref:ATP synthase F0 subunit 8 n=1 Tax=Pseudoniphargus pedrerae TaxID=2211524 RepID=A0A345UDX9_9CRUS|nr:ATP synthase F0 subunit 8 [Pseudoniphargus pedrerae]